MLGDRALPALVKVLDDHRPLPGGSIHIGLDISNRPHAFEGIYHTSASQVVEALCMALEQITQDGLGSLSSTSTNLQRDQAVQWWRLYLGHSDRWRHELTSFPRQK